MDTESLKRVLQAVKGEARKMRLGNLTSRMAPKKEKEPMAAMMEEESPPEETPDELAEGEVTAETPLEDGEEDPKMKLAEIKKLLARV